jgi:tripartite-type tricarboxylate transporter receptor subunit TctC
MKRYSPILIGLFLLFFFYCPCPLFAAPFYEGKVLTIIVGYGPGGGYDRVARLLAKYLPNYIPGKPTVLVQNMPGADSMIAANHLYNIAKPDGLTIGTFNRGLVFANLVKAKGVRYDLTKFSWIGSAAVESSVLIFHKGLAYHTIEDVAKSKSTIAIGCTGSADAINIIPIFLKEFLGYNFKFVTYPSGADIMLAIERKEVDGRGASYSSVKPFIERGLVVPVLRGRVVEAGIEQLPVDEDLAKSAKEKTLMAMRSAPDRIGRPYVAPPGTPDKTMTVLREAFAKVVKDPALQQDAKKNQMSMEYVNAGEVHKVLQFLFTQPSDIVNEFGKYVKF